VVNLHRRRVVNIKRRRVVNLAGKSTLVKGSQQSETDILKLVHELEVHQVELELQNQELTEARTVAQDVTNRYTELYDFAPLGYFTLSKEGEIIETNISGSQMLGKERSFIKASRFGFFVSVETKPIFNNFLKQIFDNKTKETCEVSLSVQPNIRTDVYLTGIISGTGEHCLVISADISDQKQAERKMLASETLYRRLFETAKDGILILDVETGMIKDVNPFLIDLLGYSKETFIDKQIWEIGSFKDIAANKNKFLELQQKRYVRYDDLPLETSSGRMINVEFVSNVYLEEKKEVIQCNIRDITRRKQIEAEILRKNEDLQRINAEKDKFFSIIAHDLRSPFSSFLGLTELMAERISTLPQNDIQKMASLMHHSAGNLFRLLENLLEWSRMRRGLTTFVPKSILLMPKISSIMFLEMDSANKKNIKISYVIPENLIVFADENMLDSIMRNLVSNAVKFTPVDGSVTVSAWFETDKSVVISVKDTGIGMNQNMIDNLFKLEVNSSRKGTEGEISTGLGLFICKDFVDKHSGVLRVVSEEGKGTTFLVLFPGNTLCG
jgi:PAS domain S-box-containing protein